MNITIKITKYAIFSFIILILIIIFKLFFAVIKVYANSMESTLSNNDYGLLFKSSSLNKNDIVVFNLEKNNYVKRCVATSGDTINIIDDKTLVINNDLINEQYLNKNNGMAIYTANKPYFMKDYIVPFIGFKIELNPLSYRKYGHLIGELEDKEFKMINDKFVLGNYEIEDYTFKENCYFLLGDNRNISKDSRYYGAIPKSKIVGKLIFY